MPDSAARQAREPGPARSAMRLAGRLARFLAARVAGLHAAPRVVLRGMLVVLCSLQTIPAIAQGTAPPPAELDRLAAESVRRWESSAHGQMLVRILPQRLRPSTLPEPASEGARLTALYCVQCHHLPSPAMHEAGQWEKIVERMLPRMRGEGNLGQLMARMMVGPAAEGGAARPLAAPSEPEVGQIVAYLRRHALAPIGDDATPLLRRELAGDEGRMFAQACSQCHALPDPASRAAGDWPEVVQRMQGYMQWMNRVAGGRADPREPQLRPAAITAFLQRHARPLASR